MKHLLLFALLIFTSIVAAAAEPPAKPSLVAYWNFDDETVTDLSGNGHGGSGAKFVDAPDGFGRALDLQDSFSNIGGIKSEFSLATGTVTFRVRLDATRDR
jgi:hypothetical protein